MRRLLTDFLYFHGFFVFLLYLVGNFFTVIILEYRLKNKNLRHTIAAFICIALSGFAAYYIPIFFLGTKHSSPILQLWSVLIACAAQSIFWIVWFKKRLRSLWPALAIAFGLSVLVAMLMYNSFIGYFSAITRSGLKNIVRLQ